MTCDRGSARTARWVCYLPIACCRAIRTPDASSVNLHAAHVRTERRPAGDGLGCRGVALDKVARFTFVGRMVPSSTGVPVIYPGPSMIIAAVARVPDNFCQDLVNRQWCWGLFL